MLFDIFCIMLTLFTLKQLVETYFKNKDSSAISLQMFSGDKTNDKYPTFTFCFEDSNRGDMYLRFPNANAGKGKMILSRPIDPCRYYNLNGNNLYCSEKFEKRRSETLKNFT